MKITEQDIEWVRVAEDHCLTYEDYTVHRCKISSCNWDTLLLRHGDPEILWDSPDCEIIEQLVERSSR